MAVLPDAENNESSYRLQRGQTIRRGGIRGVALCTFDLCVDSGSENCPSNLQRWLNLSSSITTS
jgi:hypothetical protein